MKDLFEAIHEHPLIAFCFGVFVILVLIILIDIIAVFRKK